MDEVVEVWGERTDGKPTVTYTADQATVETARRDGKIVMQWDEDLFTIEDPAAGEGYFLNHSCDSNLGLRDAFTLIARRDIRPGQEVPLDYGLFESDSAYTTSWHCQCGASVCRGRITGADWQRPDVQARYAGYFSPLLQKRIERS